MNIKRMKLSKYLLFTFLIIPMVSCGHSNVDSSNSIEVDDSPKESAIPHEVVNKTLGANGGSIEDEGNAKVSIPSGALSIDTNISLQYVEEPKFLSDDITTNFLGAIEFGPSGTSFNAPVEVNIKLTDTPKNSELSVFCYDEINDIWDFTTSASINNEQATFTITHFSKYKVLDITPNMLEMFNQTVRAAKELNKSDSWIMETYHDYLVNEEHIMDYYACYDGLYYEPCGLNISSAYHLNGVDGDPDELNKQFGKTNKVGNKYGLSNISGETTTYADYLKNKKGTTESKELFYVSVIIDYKMIKPNIDLSATESALKKGEKAQVNVFCHYLNPSNYFYPDFILPYYPLDLPFELKHLKTNKDSLTTNSSGRTSFEVTSLDGNAETIKVMFYVSGPWGEYSASFISFAKKSDKSYNFTGHIVNEASYDYRLLVDDEGTTYQDDDNNLTLKVERNMAGKIDIRLEYDISGIITWTDKYSFEGVVSYSNVSVSINSSKAEAKQSSHTETIYHNPDYSSITHNTQYTEYFAFEDGGKATINTLNQVGFSGSDVFGMSFIFYDDDVELPNLVDYKATGHSSYKYTFYRELNGDVTETINEGDDAFDCEMSFTCGPALMGGFEQKEGTQTLVEEGNLKNSMYIDNPYDLERYIVEDSIQAKTTQTLTLTKRK